MYSQEEKDTVLNHLATLADAIRKDQVSSVIFGYTLETRPNPNQADAYIYGAGYPSEMEAMRENMAHYLEGCHTNV